MVSTSLTRAALVVAGCGVLGVLGACHGKDADTTPKSLDAMIPKVDDTLCDTNGKTVVTADLNHDNKPDVWRVYQSVDEGGTKVEYQTCLEVDFDHDGKKDWVVAFNRKGNRLWEKADFDFDGRWDMSAVYDPKTGLKTEVERDTNFDGKFDEKEIYDSAGQLVSIERDRNGDGKPDYWEQYKDGVLIAILYDDDFDGKVDRREEIPGAHPKVEMPTVQDPTATSNINTPPPAPAPTAPAGQPPAPAPTPNK
jgi:hypothetical protein